LVVVVLEGILLVPKVVIQILDQSHPLVEDMPQEQQQVMLVMVDLVVVLTGIIIVLREVVMKVVIVHQKEILEVTPLTLTRKVDKVVVVAQVPQVQMEQLQLVVLVA
tara:strand:- start:702 stop:1022 length:321 start_codon:yes stop_codon:yes gene_type:complete